MIYDTIIIGAGVVGCAAARFLSAYLADVLVLEREEDVCAGTSKANSAIIHSGYDAPNGTLKARYNVLGNAMTEKLSSELDFPFERRGSLTVCTDPSRVSVLEELRMRGEKNGVPGLRILDRDEALRLEPNLADGVVAALFAPTAGIVCPFKMTIAFAENACENGAEFRLNTRVTGLYREDGLWRVQTDRGEYTSKTVVNAAGVYADVLNNLVSERKLRITPRRGDYILLDRAVGGYVRHTVFPLPTKLGKGVLVTPTVHGNTIVGPTAVDIEDRESTATTADGINTVLERSSLSIKNLPVRSVITSFAGLRAHEDGGDFVIGEPDDAPGFFNCAGIESPGLSAAPAIGEEVARRIAEKLKLKADPDFKPERRDILDPSKLSTEERNILIKKNPAYGAIVCRCEGVTEGEILEAIRRPLGARSLDAVKRRVRAGMGRCQGGFCSPKVMELISRECGIPLDEVTKCGGASRITVGRTKEG